MREQRGRLKVSTDGKATIVEFADKKILDEISISQIGEQLYSIVANSKEPTLILDFSSVGQMSSMPWAC